jgi:hypothetical protein
MAMKVEIRNNKLYIEIDLETPTPSASGKTLVVASTRGNAVTEAKVNDKPVIIGLNAYRPFFDLQRITCVVTGFERDDILQAIAAMVDQIETGKPRLENAHPRAVTDQGNRCAQMLARLSGTPAGGASGSSRRAGWGFVRPMQPMMPDGALRLRCRRPSHPMAAPAGRS